MKNLYFSIVLTCIGVYTWAQKTDSLPTHTSYPFQNEPCIGMSGSIVAKSIPINEGDQFSLELRILPEQHHKKSILSKILKGAGSAIALYQSNRLKGSFGGDKSDIRNSAENSLLPLGAGIIVSADKIAPYRTGIPILHYEIVGTDGKTAKLVNLPVSMRKQIPVIHDMSPITGYLKVKWLQGNGGDVLVNIIPGERIVQTENEKMQKETAEPVLLKRQAPVFTVPDRLPEGISVAVLPAEMKLVETKQATPETKNQNLQIIKKPIRSEGSLISGTILVHALQKTLPALPGNGNGSWPFLSLLGRVFRKQGMLPEDPDDEVPVKDTPLVKGDDLAEPPPPPPADDDDDYDWEGYCWEEINPDDDDSVVVPCNDDSGIPGNEFEDSISSTTSDTGLVHLLVKDGLGAIIGDFYLYPGETGYLADGSGYKIDENGNIVQVSPSTSEVTVYASEHYDESGGNVWGYYGTSSDAQQAANPQSGGQSTPYLPIKFSRVGPCFGSGGRTSGTNAVPPSIPAYNISGLSNPAVGIYNTKIEVDNDGTPNFNMALDPSYQSTTSYLTGPSSYLDASSIAYVVFNANDINSMKLSPDLKLGDIVMLVNSATGQYIFAIYGDHGNPGEAGEISYYAACQLGLPGVSQQSGGSGTINIIAFPGSGMGNNQPITQSQINTAGTALLSNNPALPYKKLPDGVSVKC